MHRPWPDASLEEYPESETQVAYSIAYVEFDDQGDLWDSRQVFQLLDHIRQKNIANPSGVFCTLFVHGWKNNASIDKERQPGSILHNFKKRIRLRAEMIRSGDTRWGETPPHVMGVYLAWRGLSWNLPIVKETTYWGRKVAASRVAGDAFAVVLSELMYAIKENHRSKTILVGHSFGGLILEQSIVHTLIAWISMSNQRYFDVPWDFLSMVNPATSAITAFRLTRFFKYIDAKVGIRDQHGNVRELDGPLLVSATSRVDYATRFYFRFGQFWSGLLTSFRQYNDPNFPVQRDLVTQTTGHCDYLFSHKVHHDDNDIWLEPIPGAENDTPYWIVQLPRSISTGHSDIFVTGIRLFAERILERNRVFDPTSQMVLIKSRFDDRIDHEADKP